jgi:hypothetical protein
MIRKTYVRGMQFKPLADGTLGMFADNGRDTGIWIADLRADGFGFVVGWDNENWGEQIATLAQAKRIALAIVPPPAPAA